MNCIVMIDVAFNGSGFKIILLISHKTIQALRVLNFPKPNEMKDLFNNHN